MLTLLIEDDLMIGEAIVQALHDQDFSVHWLTDGDAAIAAARDVVYDIALLDLGLPGRDGIEVLRVLRQSGIELPVLVITAREAVDERIHGLDSGADDYLIKPFEIKELLARMRAIQRRRAGSAAPLISGGGLMLDPTTRQAVFRGARRQLTAREFSLLQALLVRPGTILSRQALEERIYGWNEEIDSNAVEFLIHSVRKKLGSDVIRNMRGLGWLVERSLTPHTQA